MSEERAEFGARLLKVVEDRTDCVQVGWQAVEAVTAAERAARQVLEQMLKAEASHLRMPQRIALYESARTGQHVARPRRRGIFGRRFQGAGVVEAAEVVDVGMCHRRHRRRRHHHSHLRHRRHRRSRPAIGGRAGGSGTGEAECPPAGVCARTACFGHASSGRHVQSVDPRAMFSH